MLGRLRSDFQLSIVVLLGACAVLGITPFAVFRFVHGQIIVGIIDSAIVTLLISLIGYAWRTGHMDTASLVVVIVITTGGVLVATLLGKSGLYWLYPAFIANFLLVRPFRAAVANAAGMGALLVYGNAFGTTTEMVSFLVTSSVASLFAFIFASRTETQRRQLQVLATRDPLTGVENRRVLEQELERAVATHRRTGTAYGLLMLDLDHFKRVNDRHGHAAGDRVLVDLAGLLRRSTRAVDRLFRFGGEEFVLLLPGTEGSGLATVAENVREHIEAELVGPDGTVTASIGAAGLAAEESWDGWLQRADRALYRAKDAGRNRTVVAEPAMERKAPPERPSHVASS